MPSPENESGETLRIPMMYVRVCHSNVTPRMVVTAGFIVAVPERATLIIASQSK